MYLHSLESEKTWMHENFTMKITFEEILQTTEILVPKFFRLYGYIPLAHKSMYTVKSVLYMCAYIRMYIMYACPFYSSVILQHVFYILLFQSH